MYLPLNHHHQNLKSIMQREVGFIVGVIFAIPQSFKFWLAQIEFGLPLGMAALKVFLFTMTAIIGGILGKAGQDIYIKKIQPSFSRWLTKKKQRK